MNKIHKVSVLTAMALAPFASSGLMDSPLFAPVGKPGLKSDCGAPAIGTEPREKRKRRKKSAAKRASAKARLKR